MYCQVTNEKCVKTEGYYISSLIKYPIHNDIVFMGYDANNSIEMKKTIMGSQEHQGSQTSFDASYDYCKISYPLILKTISSINKLYPISDTKTSRVALNIGGGGDPSTNELAYLGYKTYLIDLEPNTLFIQKIWDKYLFNRNIERICCDGYFLPFPDNSVDLIYCKEFLHHMKNYNQMISEFSRILKINGAAVIIEPTLTWRTGKAAKSLSYHHYALLSDYIKSFKKFNFIINRHYLYNSIKIKSIKNKLVAPIFNYFNNQLINNTKSNNRMNSLMQRIIDGENIIFLNKHKANKIDKNKLINLELIDKSFLTLNESVYENNAIKGSVNYYLTLREAFFK